MGNVFWVRLSSYFENHYLLVHLYTIWMSEGGWRLLDQKIYRWKVGNRYHLVRISQFPIIKIWSRDQGFSRKNRMDEHYWFFVSALRCYVPNFSFKLPILVFVILDELFLNGENPYSGRDRWRRPPKRSPFPKPWTLAKWRSTSFLSDPAGLSRRYF